MTREAGWQYLPKPVAYLVLDKLFEAIDRIRFGVVSTNWHQIAKQYKDDRSVHHNHKNQLPMLMIPASNNHHKRRLYSISEGKIYPLHLSVPNEVCIGSCHNGWLAFANHETLVIRLMNPFKNCASIYFPPLEFVYGDIPGSSFRIKKVILSADPFVSPNDYVVLVIYGGNGRLALFKSGRNKWSKINQDYQLFTDFVFHKNTFYAVTHFSRIISLDLNNIDDYNKPIQVNILLETSSSRIPRVYLVESSKGDLLMIQRSFVKNVVKQGSRRKTNIIKVYKLIQDATSRALTEHIEITSLDGDAVFIGFNYSWCICASNFPKCIPNSIYFTNDFNQRYNTMDGPCDVGVYTMEEKIFGQHYKLKRSDIHFQPSFWVLPPM